MLSSVSIHLTVLFPYMHFSPAVKVSLSDHQLLFHLILLRNLKTTQRSSNAKDSSTAAQRGKVPPTRVPPLSKDRLVSSEISHRH